jgi:integrase
MKFNRKGDRMNGGVTRVKKHRSLTVEQFHRLLRHPLIEKEPYRTMVLLAGCTGLRRGELFALTWLDVDWENRTIRVREIARFASVPLAPRVAEALFEWKQRTPFNRPDDLIFASPFSGGKSPYAAERIQQHHLKPAGADIGFGIVSGEAVDHLHWYSFCCSYCAWLATTGAPITIQQSLMRRARDFMSFGHGEEMSSKREANSKVADLVMPIGEAQKPKEVRNQ